MFQVQLINAVVEWERRLQMEEERRENLKGKPYEEVATTSASPKKERRSILTRRFQNTEAHQPANHGGYEQSTDVKVS